MDENLNYLTTEEKQDLIFFFKRALQKDHLGHVLFFSQKPACLIAEFLYGNTERSRLFLKGWETWKSVEHLFPHPNFLICESICKEVDKTELLHIYFINKKTLKKCLSQYECTLQKKLGKKFTKKAFFKDVERRKTAAFIPNEALTGLLLGFGIESSFDFGRKKQKVILCVQPEHIEFIPGNPQFVKLKQITVEPVSFMGDQNSPEVHCLQTQYIYERDKIEVLLQEHDLLELVLHTLCLPTLAD